MTPQVIVGLALKASIMLTIFVYGLEANREDLLYLVRRPRVLVLSLVSMFLVMPLFAFIITQLFSFHPAVAIALIALSISPVPPLLPTKVTKSGGLAPYGLGLMVTAGAFSIVFVPFATFLFSKYFDRPFAMSPFAVAKLIVLSVLLPLTVGIVFRRLWPRKAKSISKPLARIAGVVLLLGVLCILIFTLPTAWSLVGNGTLLALANFVIAGIVVGHLLGGPGPNERVTLALSTACRHPALALAIAGANIPNQHDVLSAILLYALLNALLTIPYVHWQRKKARELEPAV